MRTKSTLAAGIAVLLELGWWGTVLLLIGAFAFLLVTPWVNPPAIQIGLAVPVAFTVKADVRVAEGEAVNARLENAGATLYYSPRSPAAAARGMAALVGVLAFALFILTQLRAVFRTLKHGQPFVPANAARIRRVGWALIAGAIVWTLLVYVGSDYAASHFAVDALRLDSRFEINAAAIVGGLIVLAIAEVFRDGTRLDEDQSLTV